MYNIQNKGVFVSLPARVRSFGADLRDRLHSFTRHRLMNAYNAAIVAFALFTAVCISLGVYAISDSLNTDRTVDTAATDSENAALPALTSDIRVCVSYHGKNYYTFGTPGHSVGELLESLGLTVEAGDTMNYEADAVTFDGMDITVETVYEVEESYTEAIPYRTEIIPIATIPKGTRQFVQGGRDGLKTVLCGYQYVDGELDRVRIIDETVTEEPITEVIYEGVGGTFTNTKGETVEYSYYIDVVATAYGGGGITASGKEVKEGMIAVDPDVIALGTRVYVMGDYADLGVCYAEDTGGFIIGNRIDVYMERPVEDQLLFGRRDMRVYILD